MVIGVAGPISTEKNMKVSMGKQYPYQRIGQKNIVAIILIYGARAIFDYFMITKTLDLSHET